MRPIFWLLFTVTTGVFLVMALWSIPKIMADADGLVAFDIRWLGYSYAEAKVFLAALSAEGRGFYLNVQQLLDSAYPALVAVVLVMVFTHLLRGIPRWGAIVLALAGAVFEYLENAAVAVMLRAGDGLSEAMVATASQWTVLKTSAMTLAMLALIITLIMTWWAKREVLR